MGIDYTAHHGIGLEVEVGVDSDGDSSGFIEYLDESISSNTGYQYFQVWNSYVDDTPKVYVVIDKPFKEIVQDIVTEEQKLKAFLQRIDVEATGEFGLYGGLEVW